MKKLSVKEQQTICYFLHDLCNEMDLSHRIVSTLICSDDYTKNDKVIKDYTDLIKDFVRRGRDVLPVVKHDRTIKEAKIKLLEGYLSHAESIIVQNVNNRKE